MVGTIIKDFLIVLFILLVGFLGGFSLYIDNNVNDMKIRLDDIKQTVNHIQQESLNEFEGKLNVVIADRFDNKLVYISCPFSYLRPGLLRWSCNGDKDIFCFDDDWLISFEEKDIKYKDLQKLKTGELLFIKTSDDGFEEVFLWRSRKTLPKDLLD